MLNKYINKVCAHLSLPASSYRFITAPKVGGGYAFTVSVGRVTQKVVNEFWKCEMYD